MKIKENIISAINNCSDMSILNQIYNDTLKCNDNLQKSYNDWINQQTKIGRASCRERVSKSV